MAGFEIAYLQECVENKDITHTLYGKMYELDPSKSSTLIGKDVNENTDIRAPSIDNKLVDSLQVSGIHASLVYEIEQDAWYVTNMSDDFGTYFKAAHESEFKQIKKQLLNNHDKIRLGDKVILEFMKIRTGG